MKMDPTHSILQNAIRIKMDTFSMRSFGSVLESIRLLLFRRGLEELSSRKTTLGKKGIVENSREKSRSSD